MKQPLLSLKKIKRFYSGGETEVKALDNVSLEINQGEYVAIMGQSGSGKTTLMNIIGCMDTHSSGNYEVDGKEVSSLTSDEKAALRRKMFGFIFQGYNLLSLSNAQENVEIPAIYSGIKKKKRALRAKELLEKLGLQDRAEHLPSELSGGQQQRVAIARALINKPLVILADEPTGALDTKSSEEVLSILEELNQEGHTIILVTHDQKIAEHAKRIITISDGKILNDTGISTTQNTPLTESDLSFEENLTGEAKESFRTAIRSLKENFFRTSLTLLGIVIGVASVIVMLAVGNGSKQVILDQINSLGTNVVNVRPDYSKVRGDEPYALLNISDTEKISNIPNIAKISPLRSSHKTLRFGNKDYRSSVEGANHSLPIIRDWRVKKGIFFTEEDSKSYSPVAVIGQTVYKNLFDKSTNPIGKYIMIDNIPFEVIGMMEERGSSPWGTDQDEIVIIPIKTSLARLFPGDYIESLLLKIKDMEKFEQTEKDILSALMQDRTNGAFRVYSASSYFETAKESQNTLTLLLASVAAISLLVGGIGVMNIMLVNVTERSREIGIRLASGARQKDIMLQFNIEAVVICTIGGIIGIIIGMGSAYLLSLFEIDIKFILVPILISFFCAVTTGIVFGYLPAKKASQVDQVAALSNE